jgi:Tfp pilus assembly protein PilX
VQLISRLRRDDAGSALMTALMSTLLMLALGLALLSIVDTQASQSSVERTRDRAFNLSESVLTSEAFVLGRNWPGSALMSGTGTIANPLEVACSAVTASATLGTTAPAGTAAALIQPNLDATYTDAEYADATWRVNVCDDDGTTTVWNDTTLTDGTKNWDKNANNLLWVRAQSTVDERTRAVAGLVKARTAPVLSSRYGLVTGNISEDLSTAVAAITNAPVVTALTGGLLNTNPPVLADPAYPLPSSGVTGLRCGLLNNTSLTKTCITGAIGALSAVPAINTLVTNGAYTQYPSIASADAGSIGQLRAQARTAGTYTTSSVGGSSVATAPACTITGTPTASTVVFIETVGTGDQYCVLNVSSSKSYKALIIGSGRVIIRGANNVSAPEVYDRNAATNLFTGVIYALNLQTSDQTASTPVREVVRVDQGARVRGAIHADGKNAVVGTVPPDFHTASLVTGLLCPGALCSVAGLVTALGLNGAVDALINGKCLVSLPVLGCTVSLPGLPLATVLGGLTAQMSTYGSAIHSDVAIINAVTVYGASGVIPGTFRDLHPHP